MAEEQKEEQGADVLVDLNGGGDGSGGTGEVSVVSPEEQQKVDGTQGIDENIDTLEKWMASRKAPRSKEDIEKEERRNRSKRVIAAVSDGLSALSNVFFTSQYAPDMFDPKNTMTASTNSWIEKARAERDKNDDAYYNLALKLGQLKHERAKTLREIEAEQERQRIAAQKAEDDHKAAEFAKSLEPYKTEEAKGKANKATSEAETAATEALYAPKKQQADLDLKEEKANTERTIQTKNKAQAGAAGRTNVKEYYGRSKQGNLVRFAKRDAAIAFERRQGTYDPTNWGDDDVEVTITEDELNGKKTTSKTKVAGAETKKRTSPTAG